MEKLLNRRAKVPPEFPVRHSTPGHQLWNESQIRLSNKAIELGLTYKPCHFEFERAKAGFWSTCAFDVRDSAKDCEPLQKLLLEKVLSENRALAAALGLPLGYSFNYLDVSIYMYLLDKFLILFLLFRTSFLRNILNTLQSILEILEQRSWH